MTEVRALSGRPVGELTLEAVRQGEIGLEDLRIHPETLERQAAIAEQHANPQLAENLRRAAELTRLGDDEVLAIYAALRPGRAQRSLREHEAIFAALKAHDGDAAEEAMREHLAEVLDTLKWAIDSQHRTARWLPG